MSPSDSTCEKSETNKGGNDVWLLLLDTMGGVIQQRTIGSSNSENAPRLIELSNGDYLLVCGSQFGISGDKTISGFGGWDLWVMRLDSNFNIIWQNVFGSSGDEGHRVYFDGKASYDVIELSNDRIAIGVSGNNVLNNGTINSVPFNQVDVWLVVIDSLGIPVWDRFAGSSIDPSLPTLANDFLAGMAAANDGGFVFCGVTASPPGGTINQVSNGESDVWIERYDSIGNLVFSRLYGGLGSDFGVSVTRSLSGGFWVCAITYSSSGFDIADSSYGSNDFWVFKIDDFGNIIFEERFGGSGIDIVSNIVSLLDSSVVVAGSSYYGGSPVKQNPGYSLGLSDYWLVQFFDETTITGLSSYTSPSHWSAYPNPVQDELTVSGLKAGRLNWRLLSVQGQVIAQGNETVQQQWRLNMQAYAQGLYFLELEQHNERGVVRVVKQ